MVQRRNGTNQFIQDTRRREVIAWDNDLDQARAECEQLLTDNELAEMNAQWDAMAGADLWQRSHFVSRVAAAAAVRERLERATAQVIEMACRWYQAQSIYNECGNAETLRELRESETYLEAAIAVYKNAVADAQELVKESDKDARIMPVVQIPRQWLEDTIDVPASMDLP